MYAAGAYQRDDGLWVLSPGGARARPVGPGHDAPPITPSRASCSWIARTTDNNLNYCETDRGHQPVRRTAAAALRLLLPGLDQPDAVRPSGRLLRQGRASTSPTLPRSSTSRSACSTTCSTPPTGRSNASTQKPPQAPRRPRLHRPGRRLAMTAPALRQAGGACHGRPHHRAYMRDARLRSPRSSLARSAAPSRCSAPSSTCSGGNFASRLPQRRQGTDPQARPAQLAPAVDRPTGTISLAFAAQLPRTASNRRSPWTQPQEAHAGRRSRNTQSRTTPRHLCKHLRRRRQHARLLRHRRAGNLSARPMRASMVAAVAPYIDTSDLETGQRSRPTTRTDFQDLYSARWQIRACRAWPPIARTACWAPRALRHPSRMAVGRHRRSRRQTPEDFVSGADPPPCRSKNRLQPVLASACAGPAAEPAWKAICAAGLTWSTRRSAGFALFRPATSEPEGRAWPFEVWASGPSRAAWHWCAVAKTLSADARANDHGPAAVVRAGRPGQRRRSGSCGCRCRRTASARPGAAAVRGRCHEDVGHSPGACEQLPAPSSTKASPAPVMDALVIVQRTEDRHRRHAVSWTDRRQQQILRPVKISCSASRRSTLPDRRRPPYSMRLLGQLPARTGWPVAAVSSFAWSSRPGSA